MRRFFVDPENISGPIATLTGTEARHISTVLRLSTGAVITLFDGSGSYYEAELTKITPNRVEARIVAIAPYIEVANVSRPTLHLGLGLLKGKKMDFVVQKITELGIDSLRPFRSQYCAAQEPDGGRLSRWQKIALEACKQCNRPKPPDLHEIASFKDMLAFAGKEGFDLKFIFWEEEGRKNLQQTLAAGDTGKSSLVLIGPEGGFSPGEVADAVAAGYKPVSLGSRILRAETAVIAATAILQYHLGNLS